MRTIIEIEIKYYSYLTFTGHIASRWKTFPLNTLGKHHPLHTKNLVFIVDKINDDMIEEIDDLKQCGLRHISLKEKV